MRQYRTPDRVQNLRLKVSLTPPQTAQSLANVNVATKEEADDLAPVGTLHARIAWQQKIFGPTEWAHFRGAAAAPGDAAAAQQKHKLVSMMQKRYAEDVQLQDKPSQIFTYTDADEVPPSAMNVRLTQADRDVVTPLERFRTTETSHRNRRMFVMGALGEKNEEVLLAIIQWSPNGTLECRPALAAAKWHDVLSSEGVRYSYKVELVEAEADVLADLAEHETAKRLQLEKQTNELRRNLVGTDFLIPSPKETFVFVRGQVLRGMDFVTGGEIYVQYVTALPAGWKAQPHCETALSSQLSTMKASAIDESHRLGGVRNPSDSRSPEIAAHWALPINLELVQSAAAASSDWPTLSFQVSSIDWWDRHVVQGYAHVKVPATPGLHKFCIRTWKPLGSTRDQMRSFFIGGSPALADISYVGACGMQGSEANQPTMRYGLQTTMGGSIELMLDVAIQKRLTLEEEFELERQQHALHSSSAHVPRTHTSLGSLGMDMLGKKKSATDRNEILERARRRVQAKRAAQ